MTTSIMVKSIEFCKLFCAVDHLVVVRRRFRDLAAHRSDHSIAKEDFLKLFAIAPDHASHVFDLFDYYHRNAIHYNNFLLAFSIFSNANNAEKVNLIREIFCAGSDREIRRPELIQIVDLLLDSACNLMGVNVHDQFYITNADKKAKAIADAFLNQQHTRNSISFQDLYYLVDLHDTFRELRAFTLEAGFRANNLFGRGTDQFPLQSMPNERFELNSLEPIVIPTEFFPNPVSGDAVCLHRFIFPEFCIKGYNAAAFPCEDFCQNSDFGSMTSGTEIWRRIQHVDCDCSHQTEPSWFVNLGPLALKGYVYKHSWFFRRLKRRWIELKNNILYSFHDHLSPMPNIVIPLAGAICHAIADESVDEESVVLTKSHPLFALQLVSPLCHLTRIIYLPTAEQRDRWVQAINIASMDFNLVEHYQMYSVVHPTLPNVFRCRGSHTGERFMVKFLDKTMVSEADMPLLRIECGVLCFLDHPDIAAYVAIYEDRTKIYLIRKYIAQWVRFNEIIGARGILSFNSVALIMRQVISGLTYLHRVGLTLGAFGPTNILLRLDSLRQHRIYMVDIGLRKFFLQNLDDESLAYVAPEVENGARPSPKADMWSIGAIIYRLLTPNSTRKNIEAAKQGILDLSRTRAPPDVINTVKRLLSRNPSKRFSAADMLRLRWIRDAVEGLFQLRLPRRDYVLQCLPPSLHSGSLSAKLVSEAGERPDSTPQSSTSSHSSIEQF